METRYLGRDSHLIFGFHLAGTGSVRHCREDENIIQPMNERTLENSYSSSTENASSLIKVISVKKTITSLGKRRFKLFVFRDSVKLDIFHHLGIKRYVSWIKNKCL